MAKTRQSRSGLTGPEGVVCGILQQATKDATRGRGEHRADAWRYLASSHYERHLQLLGLPGELIPRRIRNEAK